MHTIRARNVCEALPMGLAYLLENGQREDSRAGPVLVAPGPVTTVYERPTERVLFSAVRDANSFFHLAEALWMIAGRRDAKFLDIFVKDFGDRFAEPDGVIHGAYGHRWRAALGFDQLDAVVERLRANPADRQAVIQMWDATVEHREFDYDYLDCGQPMGQADLTGPWRDRPCNTHAFLRVRRESAEPVETAMYTLPRYDLKLDLTVLCRSNDIVWGAYGANAVHFSVLQEYLAARIGVGVGRYYQVSNNFHVYESELKRLRTRAHAREERDLMDVLADDRYSRPEGHQPMKLVDDPSSFDGQVKWLLELYEGLGERPPDESAHEQVEGLSNKWLARTAWPMLMAHRYYRLKKPNVAQAWLMQVASLDWANAASDWVKRRTQ